MDVVAWRGVQPPLLLASRNLHGGNVIIFRQTLIREEIGVFANVSPEEGTSFRKIRNRGYDYGGISARGFQNRVPMV